MPKSISQEKKHFAEKHLLPLIDSIAKSFERGATGAADKRSKAKSEDKSGSSPESPLTASTAATKLGSKSGPALAIASGFVLHRKGKDSFTRNELTQEMKSAKSYYKDSFQKNLTNSLDTLVKQGKFLHQGGENYALSVSCKADVEQKFVE